MAKEGTRTIAWMFVVPIAMAQWLVWEDSTHVERLLESSVFPGEVSV